MKKREHKYFYAVNKRSVAIYVVLRFFVSLIMIHRFFRGSYNEVFVCLLTLFLFFIPAILDRKFNIKLPTALEIVIIVFIFSAEILGELQHFYTTYKHWDTILHAVNGFLMAAIGFAMIDILNQSPKIHLDMSPVFVAFVAFCFSMTIGVVWEFFEYFMDKWLVLDMQKDFIVKDFASVTLHADNLNIPVKINDIAKTVLYHADGTKTVIQGGYLDIGIIDTMKDLFVNFIGAFVFSIIGIFYVKTRGNSIVAQSFIPQLDDEAQTKKGQEIKEAIKSK